jgi:hypothetical protein
MLAVNPGGMAEAMTFANYVSDRARNCWWIAKRSTTAAAAFRRPSLYDRSPHRRRHEDERVRQRQHVVLLARLGK